MSLTKDDLQLIREVVREEVRTIVREEVRTEVTKSTETLSGKIDALEDDIKELYFMVDRLEKGFVTDPSFKKTARRRADTQSKRLARRICQAKRRCPTTLTVV